MAKAKSKKTAGLKPVYNHATGKHQKPAEKTDSVQWWKRKLGFGNKRGEGALAKRRAAVIASNTRE